MDSEPQKFYELQNAGTRSLDFKNLPNLLHNKILPMKSMNHESFRRTNNRNAKQMLVSKSLRKSIDSTMPAFTKLQRKTRDNALNCGK